MTEDYDLNYQPDHDPLDMEGDGTGIDPARYDEYRAQLKRYQERCEARE